MRDFNRQQTTPVKYPKSTRGGVYELGTSLPAGKVVPIMAETLLRQDSFKGRLHINCEMAETRELLANNVKLRVSAYVVPFLALERFEKSRDQFDRSFMGQPQIEGGSVVPFFDYTAMGAPGDDKLYQYLGYHALEDASIETSKCEFYNCIQNFRLRNRSQDLELRDLDDTSLAQAFWDLGRFKHVLPSFDAATMEGEVALTVVNSRLPVTGIGMQTGPTAGVSNSVAETGGIDRTYDDGYFNLETHRAVVEQDPDNAGYPAIFAELAENGLSISMSNFEMAKQLQSFSKVRAKYNGLKDEEKDEYILDMLMSGYRIPDRALTQPILIGQKTVSFTQGKRYATDSDNLDVSAVSGFASVDMTLRVPELQTGGVVMVLAEAFPDTLYERQADPLFNSKVDVDGVPDGMPQTFFLPDALRDYLDPQKVDVVTNAQIDQSHSSPTSTFGWAPLNWKWNSFPPRLGGKFHADVADAADRKRFWAAETVDPVLGEDFYLVPSDLQTAIFLDETGADPFELFVSGPVAIRGITQFGGLLIEETGNYEKLESQMDNERHEQESEE